MTEFPLGLAAQSRPVAFGLPVAAEVLMMGENGYPYPGGAARYTLARDGVEIFSGPEIACWGWLHDHHSFSVSQALLCEGYSMWPAGGDPGAVIAAARDVCEWEASVFGGSEASCWERLRAALRAFDGGPAVEVEE